MKKDKIKNSITLIFFILTITFIIVFMTNQDFLDWAFERHHNKWSWYIRPVFLIPFSYFAYKRNMLGISIIIFSLFTSMFWFDKPKVIDEQVRQFLLFEKEWLQNDWSFTKIISVLAIPISFFSLGLAFWKRSLYMGLGVIILIATGKVIWSIQNGGESGYAIILPAVLGLIICGVFMIIGYKKLET